MRFCLALLPLVPLSAAAAGFVALDLPGSQLTALAEDGHGAAGSLTGGGSGGFRWQQGRGAQTLSHAISIRAISPSGRYVAGSSLDENATEVATWWDDEGAPHRIAGLPGGLGSRSIGQTIDDGGELGGIAHDGDGRHLSFSWTAAGGLRTLDSGPASSSPAGESSKTSSFPRTQESILLSSMDARVRGHDVDEAVRTFPDCPGSSVAATIHATPIDFIAASHDGALRVGHAGNGGQRRAVVWTAQGGAQRLDAFLAAHGVQVPRDWTLVAATAVDAEARRIGGYGLHQRRFDSFIAELPANVRILCDSLPPPTAPQRRQPTDPSIPSQEITP